jgi:hypothetical protein
MCANISLSFTLYQNQLKMDQRPEYMTWNFETTPGSSMKYTETERYREWLPKQNSKGLASKKKNEKIGVNQTKELLHSKGNQSPNSRDSP